MITILEPHIHHTSYETWCVVALDLCMLGCRANFLLLILAQHNYENALPYFFLVWFINPQHPACTSTSPPPPPKRASLPNIRKRKILPYPVSRQMHWEPYVGFVPRATWCDSGLPPATQGGCLSGRWARDEIFSSSQILYRENFKNFSYHSSRLSRPRDLLFWG